MRHGTEPGPTISQLSRLKILSWTLWNLAGKFIFFSWRIRGSFFQEDYNNYLLNNIDSSSVSFIQNCILLRDYFSHGSFDERIKTINPILLNSILLKAIRILLIRDFLEIPNIEMLLEMP
ncbi:hypothetical protein II906_05160 [bacterium]|nr:hypothetical protein [bacterium]